MLDVIATILKAANFFVLQANSGRDALALSASYRGRIDLLLTDVKMPGMSGPYLVDEIISSVPVFTRPAPVFAGDLFERTWP